MTQQYTRRPAAEAVDPLTTWKPVTALGKMVQSGEITSIEQVFAGNHQILEAEIVNKLIPDLQEELLLIGQAKGKFGGGQRRIFRQTQKKTREGNKIQFMTCAVVGNRNGYVGVATGKSKETVPARDKAKRKARLNIIKVRRGSGSWESQAEDAHSIPFAVEGKCGSVRLQLMPAPRGKGLCIEKECAKILDLAGIKDIWSKTKGQTKTKLNMITALMDALSKLSEMKIQSKHVASLHVSEGGFKGDEVIEPVAEPVVEEVPEVAPVEEEKTEEKVAKPEVVKEIAPVEDES
jgi:small subunit ribosomal protein S5